MQPPRNARARLELGRCRYFRSVSIFGIFGIFKSRYRYWCQYFKISRYRYRYFFRYFFPTITIFPSLLVLYHAFQTVSNACSALIRFFVYGFLYGIYSCQVIILLPRDASAERGYEIAFVCLTVRPSVTIRYRDHIRWNSSKIISRPNSLRPMCSLAPNMGDLVQREHTQN